MSPRYDKYARGTDLRRQAQRICVLVIRANEVRGQKRRELVYSWLPRHAVPSPSPQLHRVPE